MIAVFLTRIDSVTSKKEGEVYVIKEKGVINCDFWNSPKLTDHEVIIASGKKAIGKTFKKYRKSGYHITEK